MVLNEDLLIGPENSVFDSETVEDPKIRCLPQRSVNKFPIILSIVKAKIKRQNIFDHHSQIKLFAKMI